jgi:putative glutamine amidotransferase
MAKPPRPYVGVNADLVPAGKTTAAEVRLRTGYLDAIAAAGGLPVVVPPFARDVDPDAYLDRLDGFVLSGGYGDLDPRKHGLPTHPAVHPLPERRDESDRQLVRRLLQRQMPVLAIGLGVQQLNVALGGTLFLHLPEDLPRALPHRDPAERRGAGSFAEAARSGSEGVHRHTCLIEPNTRLEEIYGPGEIRVNSSHHQAVRVVAKGMRIAARSPDGVIEAIETTDADWFCIGVQWHPEAETAAALDVQLWECFVQACLFQGSGVR